MRKFGAAISVAVILFIPPGLPAEPIRELHGHAQAVFAAAFRPDGRLLATASFDHSVRLWDVSTHRQRQVLDGHRTRVLALAFSPDGSRLASADADGTILVWNLTRRAKHATDVFLKLTGHDGGVQALAFTPHGNLVSAGTDGTVRVWDLANEGSCQTLEETAGRPLYALAISADGRLAAAAGLDGAITLHNLDTGKLERRLEGCHEATYSLTFTADGRLLAGSDDGSIRAWDMESGEIALTLVGHSEPVYHVGTAADGRLLCTVGKGGLVILWNADTGDAVYSHRFPGQATCGALAPTGYTLAVGTASSACYLLTVPERAR